MSKGKWDEIISKGGLNFHTDQVEDTLPFAFPFSASLLLHLPIKKVPSLRLHLLILFSCALSLLSISALYLFIPPRATVSAPDTFVSLSLCHSFKQRRQSGHADVPGASVTVPSQVNISQRVLDDTLSLSPISPLLISVVKAAETAEPRLPIIDLLVRAASVTTPRCFYCFCSR